MASLKPISQLAEEAETLATSFEYVYYNEVIYAPVDIDGDKGFIPPIERKRWIPMTHDMICNKAREQFDTTFKDAAQARSFVFMVMQAATYLRETPPWLLIRTNVGLQVLKEDGQLYEPDGTFVPNAITCPLNSNAEDKAELMSIITEWVGGEPEIAISLLRHLATALAPHWSAGKYVLLIGNGRNGKSLLMTMLAKLIEPHNYSNITRQEISEGSNGMFDLNNKLLNIVFDGPDEFLKDSSREKTLVVGEMIKWRKLYENKGTAIQTNALFIEGLNQEPRTRDKSSALQARLVRFRFPNTYKEDQKFWTRMCSERMLGALLALLMDHYVHQYEAGVMLAPTRAAKLAQIDHAIDNSLGMQFIVHLDEIEILPVEEYLMGMMDIELYEQFIAWRKIIGDSTSWTNSLARQVFNPVLIKGPRTTKTNGGTRKLNVYPITGLSEDAMFVLNSLREVDNATAVVDD